MTTVLSDVLDRGLLPGFERSENLHEFRDVAIALNPPERLLRFDDTSTDPAHDHGTALPAFHVTGVGHDPAVQVLDRVGALAVGGQAVTSLVIALENQIHF